MENSHFINELRIWGIAITLLGSVSIGRIYAAPAKNKKSSNPEELLQQGRDAFLNYDFEEASELYERYKTLQTKSKKPFAEEFEAYENQLIIAEGAFDRVQMIELVDSIIIPQNNFFNSYKLAKSSGKIVPAEELSANSVIKGEGPAFINEWSDFVIAASPDRFGEYRLVEGRKLLDGTWEILDSLEGDFEKSGNYEYPFMSGDGQTLYFANDGDESMGGYDIFVAQRDPISGEYRQPLNLGMPFNSPYNDYMMALDEESGLGWWASDRGSEEGYVTIFVYKLDDIRKNYPSDTENLKDFARLK